MIAFIRHHRQKPVSENQAPKYTRKTIHADAHASFEEFYRTVSHMSSNEPFFIIHGHHQELVRDLQSNVAMLAETELDERSV